jgi:lathosterol oxidase
MLETLQTAEIARLALWVAEFFVGLTLFGLASGFALERALPKLRVWALPLDPGQRRHELLGNLVFLSITIASFTAVLAGHVTRFGAESWTRGPGTFVALALGFQVFYYWFHRALHHRSLVRFHRWHHVSRVTTPLSGQSTSWVEAAGWMVGYVALPVALSRMVPISASGWAWYMAYNVVGNIVGHANVEPVPRGRWIYWGALISNAFVFHSLHHARWTGHYCFAAAGMDRLFGTEWPDWMELHDQLAAGVPMTDLHQRGTGLGA